MWPLPSAGGCSGSAAAPKLPATRQDACRRQQCCCASTQQAQHASAEQAACTLAEQAQRAHVLV